MAGRQWDYGAFWIAESQWVEFWPTYKAVGTDTAYSAGELDADTDTNDSEDSGRETLDLSSVVSMPDAQQLEHIYWAYIA
eukprot:2595160-Lingulodinium_polyedra.AAC.1